MAKNVAQLNLDPPEDHEDELDAEQYREELANKVTKKDFTACFAALDEIEEQRATLVDKKKSIIQELVNKGCHRQGVMNAWKRHSKPKRQQSKIDATFKVACELVGGQGDLFGAERD